jgi:hypothetical protein
LGKQQPVDCIARLYLPGLFQKWQCRFMLAHLHRQGAKTMKRFRVFWMQCENLPIQGLSLRKPPPLLVFGGEPQVLLMVRGQLQRIGNVHVFC